MLRIFLNDFIVHRGNCIEFTDGKVYVLFGENGAGKSTIVEAVLWTLFGHTIRGGGSERIVGEVTIQVETTDGKQIQVTRRKTQKGVETLRLLLNGRDISYKALRDTQTMVSKYFGLVDTFLHTQVYSSDGTTFSSMTDAERKEVLRKLLNLEVLQLARQLARTDLSVTQTKISTLQVEINLYEDRMKTIESSIRELEQQLSAKLSTNQNVERNVNEIQNKISMLNQRMTEIEVELQDLESDIELADQKISSTQQDLSTLQTSLASITKEISLKKNHLSQIKDNIFRLKNKTKCPLCNREIPPNINPVELWQVEIDILEKDLTKLNIQETEIAQKVIVLSEKLNDLKSIKTDLSDRKRQLLTNKTAITSAIETLNTQLKDLETEINSLSTNISRIEGQIHQLKAELDDLHCKHQSTSTTVTTLKTDEQVYSILYEVFGNEGLPSWLLTEFVSRLEALTNRYLRLLSVTIPIEVAISPVEQLKSGGVRDRLTIIPSVGGGKMVMVSGGERRKIDTALLMGLRDAVGIPVSVGLPLFFDEVFDRLDEESSQSLADLLSDYASTSNNAIVVISHSKDILGLFTNAIPIEVIRDGNKAIIQQ